jgi:hypothetical protein
MSIEQRLQEIAAKQSAAEAARMQREDDAALKQAEQTALRERVESAWAKLKTGLDAFIQKTNETVPGENKKVLVFPNQAAGDRSIVDTFYLALGKYPPTGSLQRCIVTVQQNGVVMVRMGTTSQMPAKSYSLDALTATDEQIGGIVLDFLDINI